MITITLEEINQFRSQLKDDPKALAALDVIEECEGYVSDAISLLLIREKKQDSSRSLNELLQKFRKFFCQEEIKDFLESGLIAPIVEPVAVATGLPVGIVTALSICVFKLGAKQFCSTPNPPSQRPEDINPAQ